MRLRRLLFGIAVLSISFLAIPNGTQAKDQFEFQRGPQRATNRNNFIGGEFRHAPNQLGTRVHVVTLSKRELQKLIKAAVKRCGCTSTTADQGAWTDCFTTCLEGKGVSAVSAAACAAACANNLVGCAICAGIHQWIVMGCAQYCVWRDVLSTAEYAVSNGSVRPRPSRETHQAKLLINSGDSGS